MVGQPYHGAGNGRVTRVTIPTTYVRIAVSITCFQSRPDVTAACVPKIKASSKLEATGDYTGRYPPLYYFTVGLPSRFTDTLLGVRLMRLLSALAVSGFLGLAVATARRWSTAPLLPVGIFVAATPTALFIAATINPSGLEIASAITAWTAAVVLVTDHVEAPPRGLLAVLAASAGVLALVRGDSPAWLGVMLIVLCPMWVGRLRLKTLLQRRTLVALGGLCVAVGAALAWTFIEHALRVGPNAVPAKHDTWVAISMTFGRLPVLINQEIGIFGWLDTPAPWITTTLWYLLVGAAAATGVLLGRVRQWLTLTLAFAAPVIVIVTAAAVTYRHDGGVGQGRDYLPIAVGIPIVALGCARFRGQLAISARAVRVCLGLAVAISQFFAFYYTLRRYRVGNNGPVFGNRGIRPSKVWNPPFGTITLEVLFLVACAAIVFALGSSIESGGPELIPLT